MTITVKDIFEAHRNAKRLQNYAERNMGSVPIEEVNTRIEEAREILGSILDDFMAMDVSTLTRDRSDLRRALMNAREDVKTYASYVEIDERDIRDIQNEIAQKTGEYDSYDLEAAQKELERDTKMLEEARERVAQAKADLAR